MRNAISSYNTVQFISNWILYVTHNNAVGYEIFNFKAFGGSLSIYSERFDFNQLTLG